MGPGDIGGSVRRVGIDHEHLIDQPAELVILVTVSRIGPMVPATSRAGRIS